VGVCAHFRPSHSIYRSASMLTGVYCQPPLTCYPPLPVPRTHSSLLVTTAAGYTHPHLHTHTHPGLDGNTASGSAQCLHPPVPNSQLLSSSLLPHPTATQQWWQPIHTTLHGALACIRVRMPVPTTTSSVLG
jgi:hypothetical protein